MAQKEATLLLKIKETGSEVVDKLSDSLSALKGIGIGAFAAISAAVVYSIAQYKEQEEASNALTQSMVNAGTFSVKLKQAYEEQADALSKVTMFGDEQIIKAQALLQAQIGNREVTKELTRATLDFAQAQGISLESAASALGKSIGSANNALGRYGIEVDANASKSEKLAQVIDGVERKFGGFAEAATDGLGGISLLTKSIGEFAETIGGRLAPIILIFVNKLREITNEVSTNSNVLNGIISTFVFFAKSIEGVILLFKTLGEVAGISLGSIAETLTNLVEGNFKKAWESTKLGFSEAFKAVELNLATSAQNMAEIEAAANTTKLEVLTNQLELERQTKINAKLAEQAELDNLELTRAMARQTADQLEIDLIGANELKKSQIKSKALDEQIKKETDTKKKIALLNEQHNLSEQQKQLAHDKVMEENRKSTLNTIATLQKSNNSTLAAVGKAAAITQIAIETPVAIAKALAAFPPPFNFAAAGLVGAAMAVQASQIAGVQLADGGIVRARPGGTQATIGEGGQDEAVIPLDKAGGFGGGITINVYGGMLGDPSSAREFAIAIDRQLLNLRRDNQSVSFDSGLI